MVYFLKVFYVLGPHYTHRLMEFPECIGNHAILNMAHAFSKEDTVSLVEVWEADEQGIYSSGCKFVRAYVRGRIVGDAGE